MINRKKIATLLTFILLINLIIPTLIQAGTINSEQEYYNYLIDQGLPLENKDRYKANYTIYKTYNLIVYGSQTDVPNNDRDAKTKEYRYLGFDLNGNLYTNPKFPPDDLGELKPWEWDYIKADNAINTWNNHLIPEQENHMLYSPLINPENGATGKETFFNVQSIGGKDYAKVQSPATWKSAGSVYTLHKYPGGKVYYATFETEPLISGYAVNGELLTPQNTYTIPADKNGVTVPITVNARANTKGDNVTTDQITEIKAGYQKDYVSKTKTESVTFNKNINLTRDQYPPGIHTVKLEGFVGINSIFGDKETKPVSKTITLIVEGDEDTTPKDKLVAKIYTPKETYSSGENLGYEDQSTPPKNGTIVYRNLKITDAYNNVIKTYDNQIKPSISLNTEGQYTLTLKVVDNKGNMDTDIKTIIVEEDSAEVNAVLDISVAPDYETLYYSREDYNNNKATELWVSWDAEDSTSTNGIDLYRWYKDGDYKGSSKEGHYKEKIAFSPSNPSVSGSVKVYDSITDDSDTAYDSLTIKFDILDPPIALIDATDEAIQGEDVLIRSDSDCFGKNNSIVSYQWNITSDNGYVKNLEGERNVIYFDQIGLYTITLTIKDAYGQTDTTTKLINILPDNPKADIFWEGTSKVNRKVSFNASRSIDSKSNRYTIDHAKNVWTITPLNGQSTDGIKVVNSSDLSKRDVLFKEPGDYYITLEVENSIGNKSQESLLIYIAPDESPISNLNVSTPVVREPDNENRAKIILTDNSYSPDGDIIAQKTWKYKYDANNNGDFSDEDWIVLGTNNNSTYTFYTEPNEIGKYKFLVDVMEGFGEETIPEFLTDFDYRRDISPNKEVEVKNIAPATSFETIVNPLADVSMQIVSSNTTLVNNFKQESNDFIIDIKNNNINVQSREYISEGDIAKANNLVHKIRFRATQNPFTSDYLSFDKYDWQTGIGDYGRLLNYSTEIDNNSFHSLQVEVSQYESGNTSSKPKNQPPKIYYSKDKITWKNLSVTYTGILGRWIDESGKHISNSFDYVSSPIREDVRYIKVVNSSGNVGSYDIVEVYASAWGYKETIVAPKLDDNKFHNSINDFAWRDESGKYAIFVSDQNSSISNLTNIINTYKSKNIKVLFVGNSTTRSIGTSIANGTNGEYFELVNNQIPWDQIEDFVKIDTLNQTRKSVYILQDEIIKYETHYSDYENDPNIKQQWRYTHDESIYDNNQGKALFNNIYLDNSINQFSQVGKYTVEYLEMDNPKDDSNFENYNTWSRMLNGPINLYVHRKPIADFTAIIKWNGTSYDVDYLNNSYDLDHTSITSKGIVDYEWRWKKNTNTTWTNGKFTTMPKGEIREISLRVKDMEGVWSDPYYITLDTKNNNPPIAEFTVNPNPAIEGGNLTYQDKSFDPDGDAITERQWRSRKLPSGTWINHGNQQPGSFNLFGNYEIELKVKDSYEAWSNPYTQILKVDPKNRPPVANFTYSPSVIYEGDTITLTDLSTDPDNNITSHYWTITDPDGNIITRTTKDTTISNAKAGTYTVTKKVTDSYGLSSSKTTAIYIYQLSITGFVNHTELWNQHRIDYNLAKTGTPELPRTIDVFFPGEKFVLKADTLGSVTSVLVEIRGTTYSTNLNKTQESTWEGSLWHEDMMNWQSQDLVFRFTAISAGGVTRIYDVPIRIEDDPYWRQHGKY